MTKCAEIRHCIRRATPSACTSCAHLQKYHPASAWANRAQGPLPRHSNHACISAGCSLLEMRVAQHATLPLLGCTDGATCSRHTPCINVDKVQGVVRDALGRFRGVHLEEDRLRVQGRAGHLQSHLLLFCVGGPALQLSIAPCPSKVVSWSLPPPCNPPAVECRHWTCQRSWTAWDRLKGRSPQPEAHSSRACAVCPEHCNCART